MRKFYLRVGIIVAIFIIVVIVTTSTKKPKKVPLAPQKIVEEKKNDKESVLKKADTFTQTKIVKDTNISLTLTDDVLAMVNNQKITKQLLDSMLNVMPPEVKEYYKNDKIGFLEELIIRQLLIQEAKRQKIDQEKDYKEYIKQNPDKKEDIMVNLLLRKITSNVTVSENELKEFFDQYKDQLPNKDYESVKEQLRPMAIEEKQRQEIEKLINTLKAKAKIVRNEKWIKEEEAITLDNPLTKALKSGRPVLVDFGRGNCLPCKMMQPILEKLQKEYKGKVEILILDVGEYPLLARKYKIMVIPTQIFFDSSGKEVYRHQGFMPEEDIIKELKKLGIE